MCCMFYLGLSIDIWCVRSAMLWYALHVLSIWPGCWHLMCSLCHVVTCVACSIGLYLLTSNSFALPCCEMCCMLYLSIDIWCVRSAMLWYVLHVISINWHLMRSLCHVVICVACCIYQLTSDAFTLPCCDMCCTLYLSIDIWCVRSAMLWYVSIDTWCVHCVMLCCIVLYHGLHAASIHWHLMCSLCHDESWLHVASIYIWYVNGVMLWHWFHGASIYWQLMC